MMNNVPCNTRSQCHAFIESCRGELHRKAQTGLPKQIQAQAGVSDLVQETCLRAYSNWSTFRGRSVAECKAWLSAILKNHVINLIARCKAGSSTKRHQAGLVRSMTFPLRTCHDETPSQVMMAEEERQQMDRAFAMLTDDECYVLERHHRDQWTFAQLGSDLHCTEEAARKRWARALLRWQRLAQTCHG
jgi:RNA polymerase sigma factor (sigma-70 family)